MKTSSQPIGQWQDLCFSRDMSFPGLTNHLGSLQVEADPIAVKHVIFPPVSSAEETTGMTWLDGALFAAGGQPAKARWSSAVLERKANFQGWKLHTRTAMIPHESACVIEIRLRNPAKKARQADLRLRLSGRSRNTGPEGYLWGVPAVSTTVAALNRPEGLDVVETHHAETGAIAFRNISEPCCGMQGVVGVAHEWRDGWMHVPLKLKAGQSTRFYVLLCYGTEPDQAEKMYGRLSSEVALLIVRTEEYWAERWKQLQQVSVPYKRALHTLAPSICDLYDMSMATATYLRRDYPTKLPSRLYLTLFPRHGEGSFYLWDIGMAAPIAGRVDAEAVRGMVETAAAGADFYSQQCMNAFTGQGGGWFYAANLWSIFRMAWSVLCTTRDFAWLDHKLSGIRQNQTVLEMLEELALAWTLCCPGQEPLTTRTRSMQRVCAKPGSSDSGAAPFERGAEMPVLRDEESYPYLVANCGDRGTLLEATTTYQYQVASMNAGYVWMMRRVAELRAHRGDKDRAGRLRALADGLAKSILVMFRQKDGFFSCGYPDGRVVPSRVGLDHLMVMNCMPEDLSQPVRRALVASFKRELQTRIWMRIVSDREHDVVSGFRSDTTFAGSYAGWVAMMAEGLCAIGARSVALEFLEGVSGITAQGPIAQSYWVETLRKPINGGAAKCADELPHGTHWCEMGGVAFAGAIVHGLLGVPWTPFEH